MSNAVAVVRNIFGSVLTFGKLQNNELPCDKYLLFIINFGWVLCLREKLKKPESCTVKHSVVQRFIVTVYSNLHIQSVLKVNGSTVKWIVMQHIFINYDYLSENSENI